MQPQMATDLFLRTLYFYRTWLYLVRVVYTNLSKANDIQVKTYGFLNTYTYNLLDLLKEQALFRESSSVDALVALRCQAI